MSPMRATPLTIEWSLLGILRQQPLHGYALHQKLSEESELGLVWHLKQSQLYALLDKLAARGYISYTLERPGARPPRKVYALTPGGSEALRAWLAEPVEHGREFRLEFLAKIYFAHQESAKCVQTLLSRQRENCLQWQKMESQAGAGLQESNPYVWLIHQFRLGQIQAMLDWIASCQGTLLSSGTPIAAP